LQQALQAAGIGTLIHYPVPPHRSQAYAEMHLPAGSFPIAEHWADQELSLPIGPHITKEDAGYVVNTLRDYLADAH
jgi:dTDP-4-amino-4,6-dideoxygalactose transaminase